MEEVTFDLQTITPLFLAGADQKIAELRAPSFRGAMRYWLRAAVSGLATTQAIGLEEVREFEKYIFGATDQGSAIQIRIKNTPEDIEKHIEKFRKEPSSRQHISGRDYLYFSMAESRKGVEYNPARQYFLNDTTFSATLSVHGKGSIQVQKLECAIAAFWLLTTLGGIGSRSRRCAGSLSVTKVSGNRTKLSFDEIENVQRLQSTLRQGIQEIRRIYTSMKDTMDKAALLPSQGLQKANFDTLALPKLCRIWILQKNNSDPWNSVKDALSDIGKELQTYRSSISPLEERTAFGLPLIVQNMPDSDLKTAFKENRRSSPLLLKIHKLRGEKYVVIAVLFKTQFKAIDYLPQPNYMLIEEWIEKKLSRGVALEIMP